MLQKFGITPGDLSFLLSGQNEWDVLLQDRSVVHVAEVDLEAFPQSCESPDMVPAADACRMGVPKKRRWPWYSRIADPRH